MVHWCAEINLGAVCAEFIGMMLFVMIGCGTAMATANVNPGFLLQVSLAFGMGITALAYSIGHFSGGHMNCAVTFGLVLAGACGVVQGIANFVAQFLGSLAGAGLLTAMFTKANDQTQSIAANMLMKHPGLARAEDVEWHNAFVAEIFGTGLLVFVVLQTAVNVKSAANRALACLAIGLAVFLAHCVLIPIDNCSINPTRTIGPAIVATVRYGSGQLHDDIWDPMWIFWVGPLLGAALAALVYHFLNPVHDKVGVFADKNEPVELEDSE